MTWIVSYRSYWTGELMVCKYYTHHHADQFANAMRGAGATVLIATAGRPDNR